MKSTQKCFKKVGIAKVKTTAKTHSSNRASERSHHFRVPWVKHTVAEHYMHNVFNPLVPIIYPHTIIHLPPPPSICPHHHPSSPSYHFLGVLVCPVPEERFGDFETAVSARKMECRVSVLKEGACEDGGQGGGGRGSRSAGPFQQR